MSDRDALRWAVPDVRLCDRPRGPEQPERPGADPDRAQQRP